MATRGRARTNRNRTGRGGPFPTTAASSVFGLPMAPQPQIIQGAQGATIVIPQPTLGGRTGRQVTFANPVGLPVLNQLNPANFSNLLPPQMVYQSTNYLGQPMVQNPAEVYGYGTLELDRILDYILNDSLVTDIDIKAPIELIDDAKDRFNSEPDEAKLFIESYKSAVQDRSV